MALRKIVTVGDPILTKVCRPVTKFDQKLAILIEDMIETMHAEPGVGLAANQVGDGRSVVVIDLTAGDEPGQVKVLINPKILETSGSQTGDEGCLSFPGIYETVTRPFRVRYSAYDLDMQPYEEVAEEFGARAVLHECDHLQGTTFIDKMSPLKRRLVLRKIKRMQRDGEWVSGR